eukprot:15461918-Alexandrium_andersonii.AAC.1
MEALLLRGRYSSSLSTGASRVLLRVQAAGTAQRRGVCPSGGRARSLKAFCRPRSSPPTSGGGPQRGR